MALIKLPLSTRLAIKAARKNPKMAVKVATKGAKESVKNPKMAVKVATKGAKASVKPVRKMVVSQIPKPVRDGVSVTTQGISDTTTQAGSLARDLGARAVAMPVVLLAGGVAATQRVIDKSRTGEISVQRAREASARAIVDAVQSTTQTVVDSGAIEAIISSALRSGVVDRIANVLIDHPELLETEAATKLSEQLLASPQAQMLIERVADSPEVRKALAQQTAGIADEVADGLRTRTVSADDRVERVARRLLRRAPIERRMTP